MVNTKSPRTPRLRRVALLGLVGSGSLACDLQTKAWAWDHLRDGTTVSILDPLVELVFAFNTGSAFSIVREGAFAHTLFVIAAFVAVAAMIYAAATVSTARRATFVGLGLVAAGTLGNLHDRLFRIDALGRHGVVDFMKINYPWGGSWPVFNVADVALLVGVVVLFVAGFGRTVASGHGAGRMSC